MFYYATSANMSYASPILSLCVSVCQNGYSISLYSLYSRSVIVVFS